MKTWLKRAGVLVTVCVASVAIFGVASAAPPLADGSEATPNENHCCPSNAPFMRLSSHTCHHTAHECQHDGNHHHQCIQKVCDHHHH